MNAQECTHLHAQPRPQKTSFNRKRILEIKYDIQHI